MSVRPPHVNEYRSLNQYKRLASSARVLSASYHGERWQDYFAADDPINGEGPKAVMLMARQDAERRLETIKLFNMLRYLSSTGGEIRY